jgi:hypothetical protein
MDSTTDPFQAVVSLLRGAPPPLEPTAGRLRAVVLGATGRPALAAPPRPVDLLPSALDAALRLLGGVAAAPATPQQEPTLQARLATTRRLIAEIELELERLRAEAADLERALAEQQAGADPADVSSARPADEVVVEAPGPGRVFSAIFRRSDPGRPPRRFQGYVEIAVQSPASPAVVREVERALAALPGVSIRLVWGAPVRGTTIGVDVRQPTALAEQLRVLDVVESVQELGDRGGVGRLRLRLRER